MSEAETLKAKEAVLNGIPAARADRNITQVKLSTMSGVAQPVIARMEKGAYDPRLSTVLRVLDPMGLTLAIVEK